MVLKLFTIFFCIVFILFAAVQYNDPDPYLWMPIYLYTAVLCWLAFRNKFFPGAYLLGMAVYAAYAIYKFFDQNGVWDWITKHHEANIASTMKAEQPWIDRPELHQQERDRGEPRHEVQPLADLVDPDRPRRQREPAGRVLLEMAEDAREHADAEGRTQPAPHRDG